MDKSWRSPTSQSHSSMIGWVLQLVKPRQVQRRRSRSSSRRGKSVGVLVNTCARKPLTGSALGERQRLTEYLEKLRENALVFEYVGPGDLIGHINNFLSRAIAQFQRGVEESKGEGPPTRIFLRGSGRRLKSVRPRRLIAEAASTLTANGHLCCAIHPAGQLLLLTSRLKICRRSCSSTCHGRTGNSARSRQEEKHGSRCS